MDMIPIETPQGLPDYELIDSGNREKLERFSSYTIIRPDPRILWSPNQKKEEWDKADARYIRGDAEHGEWNIQKQAPTPWLFRYNDLKFLLKPTDFKHVGIFPEQSVNWDWLTMTINKKPLTILNLFGYTGAASLVSVQSGAKVTHVDSSKPAITWANENYKLNNLPAERIRWIEDDAYKFVVREQKRGNTYDGIIMDPPRFGRGNKGEVWKLTEDLPKLLDAVKQILSPHPAFLLLNAYTADISVLSLQNLIGSTLINLGGTTTCGELALKESKSGRLLPNGLFVRWIQS